VERSKHRFVCYYLPAIVYAAAIFILSSIPGLAPPEIGFRLSDKFYHFLEFFGFGFVLLRAFVNSTSSLLSSRSLEGAAFLGGLYALSDELHQHFVPNRQMEFWDFLADTVGILTVCLIWWGWKKLKKSRVA
jgi:VanZ family protein